MDLIISFMIAFIIVVDDDKRRLTHSQNADGLLDPGHVCCNVGVHSGHSLLPTPHSPADQSEVSINFCQPIRNNSFYPLKTTKTKVSNCLDQSEVSINLHMLTNQIKV